MNAAEELVERIEAAGGRFTVEGEELVGPSGRSRYATRGRVTPAQTGDYRLAPKPDRARDGI